jgi:hypothetical protein
MNVTCSAEGCPVLLNGICVFYEGTTLLYTGITTNDNLQTALQKIDAKFADAAIGYAFNNGLIQSAPGQPVQLGGSLIQDTSIGGNYKLAFVGKVEASALITTGGTSSQFVKGNGSLDSTSYQPSGNYITNLTGDVTASGPGSVAATLATVFGAPGTYGNSGIIPSITVDGKGRVTNVTPVAVNYPAQSLSFVGDVDGFGFTGSPVTLTLDTVNTDIYGSNNFLKFSVNGKGLITSATPVSDGDITTALGYVPVDNAIELTINGVAYNLAANRDWEVGTVTGVSIIAGTGLNASISNPNTTPSISIVNTAPDQTVVLNGGFGISVTGSYPNFTVTNDYPSLGGTVTNFSAGNLSPLFTTSVTNSSTTPALSFALSSAAANTVLAGPNGGAGAPSYRALVAADIPSLSYISNISTTAPLSTTGGLTPTLSISQANSTTDGYLSSVDWNTFNNKEDALGYTPVPDSRQLTINGTVYDLTADRTWSVGTVTSITASAPLTGGTITGSGSVGITQAGAGSDGYLSSADWNTFDGKQPAGNYITDLTGDATASGPGSVALTLATVNATTGTFGSSTQVPVITVNNKGLVTCVTTDTISGSLEFVGDVTGVGSTGTCTTLTLATVNNDVYTSETLLNVAVNGKGLITSANPTTAGDICSTLGYTPENVANKSTCTSLGVSNTLYPTQLAVKTYVDNATAGGIILQGNWNANTNTPNISGTTTTGWAWRVDVAGTTNLGGITDWQVGDLAVKSATGWVKIDNTENVTSVFGRFGAIVATTGDYLTCQVTECNNLYYTDARVRAAVGHTAPLTYNSTTGVFGITQSNTTTDGYLSATDWNTFNDKQPLIAAGTTSQYYRGDKTFQTLDTSVVTEGTNLYFTDARARAAISAGSGISYNSTSGQITNSCPDQIVSLTGGGTTSITGTYPNFTISSSDACLGTVTCVAVTGTNIGVTGSPITSSGTIGLSLSGANVCSALGYTPYNATNPAGYTTCVGTVTSVAACTSTTGVSISGSPITGSGTLGFDIATASSVCTGLLTAADWNTFNSKTSCTGTVTSVGLTSSTTGVSIGSSPITTSGNISLNIATASATCTGLLTSADWNSFNSRTSCTGTVTCVNATGTNISVTGSPITTSGTLAISLSGANVCSALGYTPYNATNPSGYTTCTGTVTSVGIVATNINVCSSPVTTSGNICLNLTGANVCSALGYTPAPSSSLSSYLPLAGGTMSGSIAMGGNNITGLNNITYSGSNTYTGSAGSYALNLATNDGYASMRVISNNMGSSPFNDGMYIGYGNASSGVTRIFGGGSTTAGIIVSGSGVNNVTIAGNIALNAGNYNSYSPTLTGGGASGTWGINITGDAATVDGFSASQSTLGNHIVVRDGNGYIFGNYINMTDDGNPGSGTGITSFITKRGDNYYRSVSVVNAADSIRAGASGTWSINVTGSAGSAGSASTASLVNGTSGGAIQSWDVRTISPSTMNSYRLGFGFTSYNNNNTSPWADYLHLRSYSDGSGGADNLITFSKSGIGMRIWQQSFGSSSPYSSYADVITSANICSQSVSYANNAGNAFSAQNASYASSAGTASIACNVLFTTGSATCSTVRCGNNNTINSNGCWSFVGGRYNTLDSQDSVIAGGTDNCMASFGSGSFIGAGTNNMHLCGFTNTSSSYSFIGAGLFNCTRSDYSSVVGGSSNFIGGVTGYGIRGNYSFIGGGNGNNIYLGQMNTIGGGQYNCIDNNYGSNGCGFIGGGQYNSVNADFGTVGGGCFNAVYGYLGTVVGGQFNCNYGNASFIGGGLFNSVTSGCAYGVTIVGGGYNYIQGGSYNFIGGGTNNSISSSANSSSIIGGGSNTIFASGCGGSACNIHIIGGGIGGSVNNYTYVNNLCQIGGGLSDCRVKNNICNTGFGLNEILQLRPVSYCFNGDTSKKFGFIAQEVQDVLPELVNFNPVEKLGPNNERTVFGEGEPLLEFDKDAIFASYVNAFKDLYKLNEELQARVSALEEALKTK